MGFYFLEFCHYRQALLSSGFYAFRNTDPELQIPLPCWCGVASVEIPSVCSVGKPA